MVNNFLQDYALKTTWCSPDQDTQYILNPVRITPNHGVWTQLTVLFKDYKLPVKTRTHAYQVGLLYPKLIGFFPIMDKWIQMSENCSDQNMIVDIYTDKGIKLPNHICWYLVTKDRNLLIAVQEEPTIKVDFNVENIFVRVYTNSYFESGRVDPNLDFIHNEGKKIIIVDDIYDFNLKIKNYENKQGYVYKFVNGLLQNNIDISTTSVGDQVEFVYDSSVSKVIDFKVKTLHPFNSILDNIRKYLLHYQKSNVSNTIEYVDDNDIYLCKPGKASNFDGVYYHKNNPAHYRMITHRDYSIGVDQVVRLAKTFSDDTDPETLIVRLIIRHSGYSRDLVYEHNRIHELYKLSDFDIKQAMVGIDSTVPNWRADVLENSAYTKIMSLPDRNVSIKDVEEAYGYNAISKVIGDTPSKVEMASLNKIFKLPYILRNNSTVYNYDKDGLLIDWERHPEGPVHAVTDNRVVYGEVMAGLSCIGFDEYYEEELDYDPTLNYRFYISPVTIGLQLKQWQDVTGGPEYVILNNKIKWLVKYDEYETLIRTDKKIMTYCLGYKVDRGIIEFDIYQSQNKDGSVKAYPMEIPAGNLDVFLNNRLLINGLDYNVKFPKIVIFNKEYLINPTVDEQKVTIRFSGFCTKDLKIQQNEDFYFVEYGLLSHNVRYNIRDDRVIKISIDGKLTPKEKVKFSEDSQDLIVGDNLNGRPYIVKDVVVPTRGLTEKDTYALRALSKEVDCLVSNYMTLKFPEPKRDTPTVIPKLYEIYSPFLGKLIYDLANNLFTPNILYQHYTDEALKESCKDYHYLLEFDPVVEANKLDDRYVIVHPHNLYLFVGLDIYKYKYISRVNQIYFNNKIDLSNFIKMVEP